MVQSIKEAWVLHVDDDPDLSALLRECVEENSESLRVVTADSPQDGLDILNADSPQIECVVSDYDMPRRNGLEFFAEVRDINSRVPFILFTGKGSEEIASEAISQGVSDYMQKETGLAQYSTLANRIKREIEFARSDAEKDTRLKALDAAREGICILDDDGTIRYTNTAYQELYGYSNEDLTGQSWTVLHPESEVVEIETNILPSIDSSCNWSGLGTGLHADGSEFIEDKTIGTLPDGELVILVEEHTKTKTPLPS